MWQVLSEAIDILQAKGYRLVTLAECLGKEPYQNVGQRGQKDVSTPPSVPSSLDCCSRPSQNSWQC